MKGPISIATKLLQDDIIIAQARKLSKMAVMHFSDADTCPDDDALILESVVFDLALVKLQLEKFAVISPEKRKSIDCLRRNIKVVELLDITHNKNLAEIAMGKFEREMRITHDYVDTRFLVSLSNHCKSFFWQQIVR